MGLIERKYEIAVCTICSSDNIFSTEHDSWCDDCREWMNAEVVVVVPEAASAGAVADERERIINRIRHMARVTLPDDVSRTALTIEKVAAVIAREGGQS